LPEAENAGEKQPDSRINCFIILPLFSKICNKLLWEAKLTICEANMSFAPLPTGAEIIICRYFYKNTAFLICFGSDLFVLI